MYQLCIFMPFYVFLFRYTPLYRPTTHHLVTLTQLPLHHPLSRPLKFILHPLFVLANKLTLYKYITSTQSAPYPQKTVHKNAIAINNHN